MRDNDGSNTRTMWSERDLDSALATLHSDVDTDPNTLDRTRGMLMRAAENPGEAPSVPDADDGVIPIARPKRTWRSWLTVAAAAAALAVGVTAVQSVSFTGEAPRISQAVAGTLSDAAQKADAIHSQDQRPGPGQFRYVSHHGWEMVTFQGGYGTFGVLAENVRDHWIPADEKQEWLERRDTTGREKWVKGTREEAEAAGIDVYASWWPEGEHKAPCGDFYPSQSADGGPPPCAGKPGWGKPTQEWMATLPREPEALYATLRSTADSPYDDPVMDNYQMVYNVGVTLQTGQVPADLRAALYRTLAMIPGVEITEQGVNLDGRQGVAIGIADNDQRYEMIIDPATGDYIGYRKVATEQNPDYEAGTVLAVTSVKTAVVDAMGAYPHN
ncbi:CU044_5270 family protein [Saccharopolyspora erythraea]|uniref:CU044_5270 family protein n=1 Tax=Saccharopolyspora erythraea TaxID=1836 RepID=UPI001BA53EB0|nr:CU044_5270 family protein [Saccharopolyspora erythraea]QUH04804.1 CU044_5270 family protein [Saccharopolyspora erythraea]